MRLFLSILIISYTFILASCDKEDYVYPNVITEFIDACTDESGTLSFFQTDKGEILQIQPREGINGLQKDSTYRTISTYKIISNSTKEKRIMLYTCQLIPSMIPMKSESFLFGIVTDPVDIQSIWKSGDYLNMVLLIKCKEKKHTLHFVDEGITIQPDKSQVLNLRLYHDRNNDIEAFTRKYYLSVPLWYYKNILNKGDKINFHIETYEKGEIIKEFQY